MGYPLRSRSLLRVKRGAVRLPIHK
jgi:hypothetical protein